MTPGAESAGAAGDATPFTPDERRQLSAVLELLIPARADRGLPSGAEVGFAENCDDPAEFVTIRGGLSLLYGWAEGPFADFPVERRVELVTRLEREHVLAFRALLRGLVSRYYVDDRVLRAIGVEPRPPFPDGYVVEDGDLLLLEAVHERGPICRPVDPQNTS